MSPTSPMWFEVVMTRSILSRLCVLSAVLLAMPVAQAEDPVAEDPVAEDPVAEDPVAEDPAEEPIVEDPVVADPVLPPKPEPPPKPPTADGKVRAREHFLRGKALQVEGKHAEAAQAYQSAHEAFFMPVMVFNIAQASRLAGEHEIALARYEEYLRLEPDGNGATHAAEFIAELKVVIAEASDAISAADGPDPRGPVAPSVQLDVDPRSVALLEPEEWMILDRAQPDTGKPARVAGIVLGVAGLAGLAAATYWAVEARRTEADLDDFKGEWGTKQLELQRNGEDQSRFALVAGGIGAILLTGGAGLYYWGRQGETEAALSLQTGSASGFVLSGTF